MISACHIENRGPGQPGMRELAKFFIVLPREVNSESLRKKKG
jgi:hypothetical protein